MKTHFVLFFRTFDDKSPSPWRTWKLPAHNRLRGDRWQYCLVAVIEDTSEKRAWEQVMRVFPDYTDEGNRSFPNREIALKFLREHYAVNAG